MKRLLGRPVARELERQISLRGLRRDTGQLTAADRLDGLLVQWRGPSPSSRQPLEGGASQDQPRSGFYMYGSVGTGKTLVMDCFHRALQGEEGRTSLRTHFHDFMLGVHEQLCRGDVDSVARAASEHRILCLDEFQVTDVADAVLLHRLFRVIFDSGALVVATSNRPPSDLYKNGINRAALFAPFERLLQQRCDLFDMSAQGAGLDYRVHAAAAERGGGGMRKETVLHPASCPLVQARMDTWFHTLIQQEAQEQPRTRRVEPGPVSIPVAMGRELRIADWQAGVGRASFAQLCEAAVGAADYIALCGRCHTVVLDSVPSLSPSLHNETRRFITFIDILYDRNVRLILSAETPLETLFLDVGGVRLGPDLRVDRDSSLDYVCNVSPPSPASPPPTSSGNIPLRTEQAEVALSVLGQGGASGRSSTMLSENVEWSATGRMHVSLAELAAVEDVSFAFQRALSRLVEMQTDVYWRASRDHNELSGVEN